MPAGGQTSEAKPLTGERASPNRPIATYTTARVSTPTQYTSVREAPRPVQVLPHAW